MTTFQIDSDLEIGSIFEVAGSSIKITLDRDITELSKSYGGSVYSVGQIGSIVKIHLGRRLVFASVGLLRLQSDEEMSAIGSQQAAGYLPSEKRVIEANLIGEGVWDKKEERFSFKRGVSHYPLPLQKTHLVTMEELEILYESADQSLGGELENKVAIGHYVGATRVQCKANIDKLFGQHCAILGSTGSGKSNAVAAVLHSVLEHEPEPGGAINPQIILIDPHGEYASAFEESSAIFHAYDTLGKSDDESSVIKLPYWLMSGDEIRSLIVGKTEVEATSQANTVYKALMHAKMFAMSLVESAFDDIPIDLPDGVLPEEPVRREGVSEEQISSFDRDRPIPFSLDEFVQHIVGRQALILKGKNWAKAAPGEFHKKFGSILNKLRVLRSDPRLHFLMADYKPSDPNLAEIISQLISTEAAEKSRIKIIDISGLRNEIAGPLAGAIARLLFQYKQFQTSSERERDPILLICEEAHRYVPNRGEAEYAVAQEAIKRIAREGRKYGLGLMLVSQRPADVEGTVISQCNSWIVLRLSNSTDQQHVARFLPDSLEGMTKLLSSLPRQEALFVGEAAAIPSRIKLRTLTRKQQTDSNDISFVSGWSSSSNTEETLEAIAHRMAGDV